MSRIEIKCKLVSTGQILGPMSILLRVTIPYAYGLGEHIFGVVVRIILFILVFIINFNLAFNFYFLPFRLSIIESLRCGDILPFDSEPSERKINCNELSLTSEFYIIYCLCFEEPLSILLLKDF